MSLLNLAPRAIETAGVQETRAFTMKANGKAFKVLIDGLYSDKQRAVIRELWSNAYDAQAAIGQEDAAFECHLPSSWEPWFSVRDYGCSMTHDEIMGLYTTVFESSKENDNTQVGKLGLGSKSPFAYTDTFTVTAFLDGEKRTYSAFIGSDYIPQIALMNREPADDQNGIEVSFPVRDGDYEAFATAAAFTAIGFNPKPIMTGRAIGNAYEGSLVLDGNGWAIYNKLSSAYAKQGCVVYPINVDAVKGATEAERGILYSGIVMDFPIGSLEIAASREGLGYDVPTINAIKARATVVFKELQANALLALDALPTIWDQMIYLNDLQKSDVPDVVLSALRKQVFGSNSTSIDIPVNDWKPLEFKSYGSERMTQASAPKRPGTPWRIQLEGVGRPAIFLQDVSKGDLQNIWGRMRAYLLATGQYTKSYLVKYDSRINDVGQKIRDAAKGAPDYFFIDLHALPKPAPKPRGTTTKVRAKVVSDRSIGDWFYADAALEKGAYYVPLCRQDIIGYTNLGGATLGKLVDVMRTAGVLDGKPVYGIPQSLGHLYNNPKNELVNVMELAKAFCIANYPAARLTDKFYDLRRTHTVPVDKAFLATLPNDHPICEYVAEREVLANAQPPSARERAILGATYSMGLDRAALEPVFEPLTWENATKDYPLLAHLREINQETMQHALDYVNFIDSRQQSAQVAA